MKTILISLVILAVIMSGCIDDERTYIDFGTARFYEDKLESYCSENYEDFWAVYRYYYNGFGNFKAFKCTWDSPIEETKVLIR